MCDPDERHEDFAYEDDTPAHARIREALDGEEVADIEEAIVLLYDMGIRDAHEITDDDMDELRVRGLVA